MKIDLFEYKVIKPLSYFGLTHDFFSIHINTLIATWLGMAVLFVVAFIGRWYMQQNPFSIGCILLERTIQFFVDLCQESIGYFEYKYFVFIASIFFFTLSCNMVTLLPFVEESTKDLNTTLAIALCSFFYVQCQHIFKAGIGGYFRSYAEPMFFLLPLEIIGKVSSIISMSFRLFGNILGGSIIFILLAQMVGRYKGTFMIISIITLMAYYVALNYVDLKKHKILNMSFKLMFGVVFFLSGAQLFFGVFEAVVQAFVLTMLSLTYLAIAVADEERSMEELHD